MKNLIAVMLLATTACTMSLNPKEDKVRLNTCLELRTMICAKNATCDNNSESYEKCMLDLSDEHCGDNSIENMKDCIQQFADVNCIDSLPVVCLELK